MKKYALPIIMLTVFEAVAVTLWLAKDNIFYLFNFSYIGCSIALGIFLFIRQYKYARRIVQLLVGLYMLVYSQFVRIWNYIKVRSTKERTLYKYVNGQAIKKKFKPEPGQKCVNRENIVYSLDFTVTPHQLRHTYITNLIYAGIDPKTVQYLAGHENSKVTMDIYAKAKYNKPEELSSVVNSALKKPVKSESGAKTGQ